MKLAVPDLVSSATLPAIAAVELGYFKRAGYDAELKLLTPADNAFRSLKSSEVDLVAALAHTGAAVFPDWKGLKLLCALSQGLPSVLVAHSNRKVRPGDVRALAGCRIAVAESDSGILRQMLNLCDSEARLVSLESNAAEGFNMTGYHALANGHVEGILVDGLIARMIVSEGLGTVVVDLRQGHGPKECYNYTVAALAATDRFVSTSPTATAAIVQALVSAEKALRADPKIALPIADKFFPQQAKYIVEKVRFDSLFYDASISRKLVSGMAKFLIAERALSAELLYEDVVATQVMPQWGAFLSRSNRQNRAGAFGE